jgi:DNA helicase-2/ATP-dependent DNA helicase PcrA
MPAQTDSDRLQALLEGLNEPQREAVTHGEGPLLILAGAGSGKTTVLTRRVAFLIFSGQVRPSEVLAITFTNKAAAEMRGRVEQLVGHSTRGMWLMTFHAACARILRAKADLLGYTRSFTIYDQADSRRLTKRCMDEIGVDPKRFTPAAVQSRISSGKNKLLSASAYRDQADGPFEEMIAEVYRLYERELEAANAMDFDDLLFRTVSLFELHPDARRDYATAFRHVLVDEYQDTNHAQYRLLQLLIGGGERPARGEAVAVPGHRNLAVVGDDAQCLVEGTLVRMGDGSMKPIQDVRVDEEVLSCFGSGDMRPARVLRTHQSTASEGVRIVLSSGRQIVSTPEHTHFAGYRLGLTPQIHMTYLMRRRDKGFRVGTSRTYTAGQIKPVVGVALRTRNESADAAWVIGTHETEADARVHEALLSLRYGLPTIPFVARPNGRENGLVGDQELIDELFWKLDTVEAGCDLRADQGLDYCQPHFVPQSHEGARRIVTVTLCADRRGRTPMHLIAVGGRDTAARAALEGLGLSVRPAKRGSESWRYESCFKDFSAVLAVVSRIQEVLDVHVRYQARLGSRQADGSRNTLPFVPAGSIRPGMAMFTEDGGYDLVEAVSRVPLDESVFDLDIEATHNFIAEGVLTHNSIYGFRGADVSNILDFERDFPDARVVKLEQNYRSTQNILSAANAVISHNREGIDKRLWSELGDGSTLHLRSLQDEHAEARLIVGEIERMLDEDLATRSEIAVLYRTNALSRVVEDALMRNEIAYQVIGGTKFYERAEVKDAMAYLSLIANPQDAVSFQRIVNSPRRGIGQASVAKVLAHASATDLPIWKVASVPQEVPGLGAAAMKAIGRFMATMSELRELAGSGVSVAELLEQTLQKTGYLEALQAERTIEAQGRLENLEQLIDVAAEFDEREDIEVEDQVVLAPAEQPRGTPPANSAQDVLAFDELAPAPEAASGLGLFLQQIALVADADSRRDEDGLITLMTLHNAKGLEYPVVFIAGCEEGVFPHSRAIDEGGIEEERRLFYVGVTRAMRELYLTYARRRRLFGEPTASLPSSFLEEVPSELIDFEEEQERGFGFSGAPSASIRPALGGFPALGGGVRATDARRRAGNGGAAPTFRLGEDVVHAAFGEGVVTAVEPDGVIVVRFAGDGSERKLIAEYAPVSRR